MATLRVHIVLNAKQNKVMGERGDAIKIKLRAPALEGKANAARSASISNHDCLAWKDEGLR
jgi:uncharacterized protein YggU (UPF0235/DUF167 family)